eukprot:g8534.t1
MVLFGGHHTAERFVDDDRLTSHFPGPGSYALGSTCTSPAEGGTKYTRRLVEDGVVRPDGSAIGFRERDSWVRGKEGPKGLTSLSAWNAFVSPATYSTEPCERTLQETAPAALINTLEPRYLSPSTRCLTPEHERAAKGVESPGPGTYYPSCEAWDFAPPAGWTPVNKAQAHRAQRSRRFNAKVAWGEPAVPRPPDPSRAAETPSKEERAWLSERRGLARRNTSPRCMWINGMSTPRGLQSWGDIATNTGPIHVGYRGDCSPQDRPSSRQRRDSKPRGPVHSCAARATSPGFREVRFLNRDLTRRGAGTMTDTPGPGHYNTRPALRRGTTFAGPKPKCSKAATVRALVASASTAVAAGERAGEARKGSGAPQGARPSPPAAAAAAATTVSQRLSTPLMGRESPGPAYNLPSDFDLKVVNKKTFRPPRCGGKRRQRQEVPKERESGAACGGGQGATSLAHRAPREPSRVVSNSAGGCASLVLGVPVKTSLGRGFLLRVRADGMTFVRLPWGVLYTKEVLSHGNLAFVGAEEDPAVSTVEAGRRA